MRPRPSNSNLSYLPGASSLATLSISSRACAAVIASTPARSRRMSASSSCPAAASIAAGGSTTGAIGCGPITLPRSPRSGIAVPRARLRSRGRKSGHVAPRRALVGGVLDADDEPLAVRLLAPSVQHAAHRTAAGESKLRDVLEADLRQRQRFDLDRRGDSRNLRRSLAIRL